MDVDKLWGCSTGSTHGPTDRTAHKFVWLLSANHRCVLWPVDQWECLSFVALNLWALLYDLHVGNIVPRQLRPLIERIRGCYQTLPLGPWAGPRANQMDPFSDWCPIYSSISNREVLDGKMHFLGQPVFCIGAFTVGHCTFVLS